MSIRWVIRHFNFCFVIAVPCAQMLNLAKTMKVGAQLNFFFFFFCNWWPCVCCMRALDFGKILCLGSCYTYNENSENIAFQTFLSKTFHTYFYYNQFLFYEIPSKTLCVAGCIQDDLKLQRRRDPDLSIQFLFFDGEEAFVRSDKQ